MIDFDKYDLNKTEDCVHFMVDTDAAYAAARAHADAAEYLLKSAKASAYLEAHGKTNADREAAAAVIIAEGGALQKYREAVLDYRVLEAKRKTAELQIEIWRTKQASRRAGVL